MSTKVKYCKEIIRDICKLIESDDYTQREICKRVGINEDTFTDWKQDHSDFSDAIKKADKKRLQFFAVEARKGTLRKIQGYDYEESHIVMTPGTKEGKGKIKEQKKIKKHVPPDTTLLMYVLNNTDPNNFRHKEHMEHTGRDGKDLVPSLSDKELLDRIEKLSKILQRED